MNQVIQEKVTINGKDFIIETGKLAKQANGAVVVRYGDTVLLVTAVASQEPREDIDFFPLSVEFEEKFYAAGKIPGGFIKREGKPGEKAILTARLIDRPLRPLFPNGYRNDVQIIATVLSVDQENSPDILGITGASAALTISDIPFEGPIGGVRIGYVDEKFVVNPTSEELDNSKLDIVVAGTKDAITMVEAGAYEVSEDLIIEALEIAQKEIIKIVEIQERLRERVGKEKMPFEPVDISKTENKIRELCIEDIRTAILVKEKKEREKALSSVKKSLKEKFEDDEEFLKQLNEAFEKIVKEEVRRLIVTERKRVDGRGLDEIREISCEVGVLPRTHGSALFTRGQTQALVITTLGATEDEQIVDDITEEENKKFMLHYNFPPFSVGEIRPRRGPGRREIGHGA
ncbi:MAG TPA: polyribonucleotide nucleotidyltransferase, partial [Candidatus Atribacteria bacterium]|nr:polyribonucleotide nucleotidyltransferase [Candidatus Atribacteria bacterium]